MIRVMSFNLRYDKPDLADFAWKIRKNAAASLITAYAPDLIGTHRRQGASDIRFTSLVA
jgi:hypothetical protein